MKPIRMIYCRGKCILSEENLIPCIPRISVSPPLLLSSPPPPASMQMTITCGEEPWTIAGGGGGEGGEGGS